jgi:hypothetical protein
MSQGISGMASMYPQSSLWIWEQSPDSANAVTGVILKINAKVNTHAMIFDSGLFVFMVYSLLVLAYESPSKIAKARALARALLCLGV